MNPPQAAGTNEKAFDLPRKWIYLSYLLRVCPEQTTEETIAVMKQLPILLAIAILVAAFVPVSAANTYNGTIAIYVVEPTSRWLDGSDTPYAFGFLDFADIKAISLDSKERWLGVFDWNPHAAGYGDITVDNIMIIAVVTVDTGVEMDANPPEGYWFNAYYVDAAAGATPGQPGENQVWGGLTHTVFIEEGTETG